MSYRKAPAFHSYILCASPRTGSTLLCDLLTATRQAGAPDSFFMDGPDPEWRRVWGLPDPTGQDAKAYATTYLAAVQRVGRGTSGIFGLRLMKASLPRLAAMIDAARPGLPSDKARLDWALGHTLYIHLSRRDKLAQAVSMVKAEQTGLWHIAPDGTELERLSPPKPPRYDFARLAAKLAELERADAEWQDWFHAEAITPLTICYETLAANPGQVVSDILTALGLDAPTSPLPLGTGKLADATSTDWISRFRAEAGARPSP